MTYKTRALLKSDCYKTLIFDCDGVILKSNEIKTAAFRKIAQPYGEHVTEALLAFHKINAGASRYRKFAYLLGNLLGEDPTQERVVELSKEFSLNIWSDLLECGVTPKLAELRDRFHSARWAVVSGSDESELQQLLMVKQLSHFFDCGIFGSPTPKSEILAKRLSDGTFLRPAIYFGDSIYDYEASKCNDLDFIFVSAWSELTDWGDFVAHNKIPTIETLATLLCYED